MSQTITQTKTKTKKRVITVSLQNDSSEKKVVKWTEDTVDNEHMNKKSSKSHVQNAAFITNQRGSTKAVMKVDLMKDHANIIITYHHNNNKTLVVVTGGSGFIATTLAQELLRIGKLTNPQRQLESIDEIILFDLNIPPPTQNDFLADLRKEPKVKLVAGDIRNKELVRELLDNGTHSSVSVFHLASILSGQGEVDFELCMGVNLDGTRNVLEGLRAVGKKLGTPQRLVFSSTNAIFGPTETITDDSAVLPQTTYGTTKAMCESMINDYTRKGFITGCGARLPSVLIRPVPNTAASNCFNAIMREPLRGIDYVLPVPFSTTHPITGKKNVVKCLIKLHEIEVDLLGINRFVVLPALSLTMQQMYDSAKRVAQKEGIALGKVTERVDDQVYNIVKNWPPLVDFKRAKALDFPQDIEIDEIVTDFYNTYVKK